MPATRGSSPVSWQIVRTGGVSAGELACSSRSPSMTRPVRAPQPSKHSGTTHPKASRTIDAQRSSPFELRPAPPLCRLCSRFSGALSPRPASRSAPLQFTSRLRPLGPGREGRSLGSNCTSRPALVLTTALALLYGGMTDLVPIERVKLLFDVGQEDGTNEIESAWAIVEDGTYRIDN